uniref:DNA gyrase subunit A, chloroplastic/mitochondrial n=1 Tax=Tanacetum cinerariifolium TaxID=118510 RepID=A0A6L2M5K5_TANCI|nr:DNA gyrase subunit A, chloroplastic/mitochondrial [Tanacetum cinerariifolium]
MCGYYTFKKTRWNRDIAWRSPCHKRTDSPWLLFVSENGYGKRVPLSRFHQSPLNRVGLIGYKFSFEDCLAAVL